jgi:hypothetical protein
MARRSVSSLALVADSGSVADHLLRDVPGGQPHSSPRASTSTSDTRGGSDYPPQVGTYSGYAAAFSTIELIGVRFST